MVPVIEHRRCKRFPFTITVKIYGRTPRNHPFRDVTSTLAVSLCGWLLDMKPRVKLGQEILVVNSFTEEERVARVVYVDSKQRGRKKIAAAFTDVDQGFWHVYSPAVRLKPSASMAHGS